MGPAEECSHYKEDGRKITSCLLAFSWLSIVRVRLDTFLFINDDNDKNNNMTFNHKKYDALVQQPVDSPLLTL